MKSKLAQLLAEIFGLKTRLALADEGDKGGGAADDAGGAGGADDGGDAGAGGTGGNQVSYETYSKTVKEIKALKRQLKEASERLSSADNDKLQADGKKDELIAKLRGDLEKTQKIHKDTLNSFVFSSLDSQVRARAAAMGCVDLEAVGKLVDLSDVEVDTKTFKADDQAVTQVLESLKKSKPYLFKKEAPKVSGKLGQGGATSIGGKSLKELSTKEIWDQLRTLNK